MDNLDFNFSSRFLWDVKMLGECLEVNDSEFLLFFKPDNGIAARVTAQGKDITVKKLKVMYDPVALSTDSSYPGLNESEALAKLKLIKGDQ